MSKVMSMSKSKFSKLLRSLTNLQLTEEIEPSIFKGATAEEVAQRKLDAPKIIVQEWIEDFPKRKDVHKNEDGSYDVDGNIDLSSMMLEKFPVKFNKISEDFWCNVNNLTTLEGAPSSVGGDFYCNYNNLTSLEGAPKEINGAFYCSNNNLTSLEGAPVSVSEDFSCSFNNLTSLEGAPKEINGAFYCNYNNLTSLEGAPSSVGGTFYCDHNNLTTLEGAPKKVGGNFYCTANKKKFTKEEVRAVSNVKGEIYV